MQSGARACLAALTGAIVLETRIQAVFDVAAATRTTINGAANSLFLSLFDVPTTAHFIGRGQTPVMFLFDYQSGCHLSLTMRGQNFSGYDEQTAKHFAGNVIGQTVAIYDYETFKWHNYRLVLEG